MIAAALKRKMTLFVFNGKGTVSFKVAALTVSIRYELLWCPYSFVYYVFYHCSCVAGSIRYELGIISPFYFLMIYVHVYEVRFSVS